MNTLDCDRLSELIDGDPGAGALAIKSAVLAGVDTSKYLSSRVSSGGRVNALGAIKALLAETCVAPELVVQFENSTQAVETFSTSAGPVLRRVRTLSEDWGMYRYDLINEDGDRAAAIRLLEAQPGLVGIEQNFSMKLRSRFPNDAGWSAQGALRQIRTPQAWQNVYGDDAPEPSDIVTAIFDQEFKAPANDLEARYSRNDSETPNNEQDDDGNGYIDDYSGFNFTAQRADTFSEGTHGLGMASILVAPANDGSDIAGVDWAGSILQLQGETLADWVEAASYITQLRNTYEATGGTDGAHVISYLTPQGGSRSLLGGPQTGVINGVLSNLAESGIITVAAMPNDSTNLARDFPAGIKAPCLVRVGAVDSIGLPLQRFAYDSTFAADITAPGQSVAYHVTATDTATMTGTSPASALVAGTIALMYQVPNRASLDPTDLAKQIEGDLIASASVGITASQTPTLNADLATYRYSEQAEGRQYCIVTSVTPTVVRGSESAQVRVVGEPGESCLVKVANNLGQIVLQIDVSTEVGAAELRLGDASWPTGVYYVSALAGRRREAQRMIVTP